MSFTIATKIGDRPISPSPKASDSMADTEGVDQVDILLVGAGFASYTLLHRYGRHPNYLDEG